MGLSSSKKKEVATPYAPATSAINEGITATNDIFHQQQPALEGLASSALAGYNAIAPQAYSASPYVTAAQNAAQGIFSQSGGQNPGLTALQGLQGGGANSAQAGYNSLAQNGGGINAQTIQAPTGTAQSSQMYADTLAGKYLDGNPYIDNVAQQATDAATRAANQRFGAAGLGAGLSSAYTDVLSKNVANASNSVRYQNYADERNRQLQAGGQSDANYNADAGRQLQASTANAGNNLTAQQSNLAARLSGLGGMATGDQQQFTNQLAAANGLGSLYNQGQQTQLSALGMTNNLTDAQYAGISPALNLLGAAANIPYYGVQALGGNLNTLAGKYGVNTQTSTPSLYSQVKQGASDAAGLASMFSDRRLKKNIAKVGELEDGLGVYDFDYVWGGDRQRGVMADEVAKFRPWALGPIVGGYATVNMGKL